MRRPNFDGLANYYESVSPSGAPVMRGRRAVVEPWQRGLLFRRGKLVANLDPGAYVWWGAGYTLRRIDTRPWVLTAPTQEIPTADGVTVKVTVSGRVTVTDPEAFVCGSQDAYSDVYLAIQVALRELVSAATVEQLVAARGEFGEQLAAAVRTTGLGLTIERLELKDIVLPPELKRAQAEVLIARAEGLAALERARGETAALRNLNNAARLAADNPALLQLRLIQQLSAGGNTVVVGGPAQVGRNDS